MKYFLINNCDGDTWVREYTKEELLEDLKDRHLDGAMTAIHDYDTNYWGERNYLIIKGEIVTPQKKEIVTAYDIP